MRMDVLGHISRFGVPADDELARGDHLRHLRTDEMDTEDTTGPSPAVAPLGDHLHHPALPVHHALAVGHRPKGWDGPVVSLGEEEVVVVVPPDDPLASRAAVRLTDLADRDWVRCALEPVVDGRRFLDLACERAGFTPRTAVDTEHTSTAVAMVAAGLGILVTPAHVAARQNCATLPLDPPWRREVTAFSRVRLTGATAAFVDLLAEAGLPSVGRTTY